MGFQAHFYIWDFLKKKKGKDLSKLNPSGTEHAYVFYVGNSKIEKFLSEIYKVWSNDATVFLAREMTKIHEQFYSGNAKEGSGRVKK